MHAQLSGMYSELRFFCMFMWSHVYWHTHVRMHSCTHAYQITCMCQ